MKQKLGVDTKAGIIAIELRAEGAEINVLRDLFRGGEIQVKKADFDETAAAIRLIVAPRSREVSDLREEAPTEEPAEGMLVDGKPVVAKKVPKIATTPTEGPPVGTAEAVQEAASGGIRTTWKRFT
jgi:hypothetical protein